VLLDLKQSVVSKKQLVVFLQQLKTVFFFLILIMSRRISKQMTLINIKRLFNHEKEQKLKTNKGKSYPHFNSSMSHVLYDQEASFHCRGPLHIIDLASMTVFLFKNLIR